MPVRTAHMTGYARSIGLAFSPLADAGAFMWAPIRHRGQGLGAICLTKKEPDPEFSREPSAAAIEPAGQGRVGAPGTGEGRRAVVRPGGELSVLHQGETIAAREAPPRAGVLRAARSELARRPDHERIASGLGSGGAPRRLPVAPAVPAVEGASNGAAVKPEPGSKQLRPPTPRQLARWKAIQQAQLQGLSMRATARLLGISRDTVSSYVRANGVPGRRNAVAASSNGRGDTDKVAALLH